MKYALIAVLVSCAAPEAVVPVAAISHAPVVAPAPIEAPTDAPIATPRVEPSAPVTPVGDGEVWLRGSTHVHARPSGDSSEPIADVIHWYEAHGYDFIALTDHNRVSEAGGETVGKVAVSAPAHGLIVLSGIELTHNPSGCLPQMDNSRKCRIHVNALGVTARPSGKQEWAERHSRQRADMYRAAIAEAHALGGAVIQINHPLWYWGMTPELLADLSHQGARLVEVANAQFTKWNLGDPDHPGTESLWDAALERGAQLWGVASDDAHDYEHPGKYPAGGGWVVVKAHRDPQAILDALATGRFYSSNGVLLHRAEVDGDELVIEAEPGTYTITWIENGKLVDTIRGAAARRTLPAIGYVRAVVTRADGKAAWIQPARRSAD